MTLSYYTHSTDKETEAQRYRVRSKWQNQHNAGIGQHFSREMKEAGEDCPAILRGKINKASSPEGSVGAFIPIFVMALGLRKQNFRE